nr:hypothetical protein [Tanacetum cinerariifolium]
MREQHNNYLEDYFDALDRSANIKRKIDQPYEKKDDDVEIGNFHECVAFLDLIRKGGALSNEWERSDGLDIRRCYLDYLEPLVSNYKAARSSNPTGGYKDEGIRRFEDYHGDGNEDGSMATKEKGRVEHFGITLEKEEEGKCDTTAHQDKKDMARIKCYLCQKTGHFDGISQDYVYENQSPSLECANIWRDTRRRALIDDSRTNVAESNTSGNYEASSFDIEACKDSSSQSLSTALCTAGVNNSVVNKELDETVEKLTRCVNGGDLPPYIDLGDCDQQCRIIDVCSGMGIELKVRPIIER